MITVENSMMERFLTLKEVKSRYGLCASTIYNNIQAGRFPAPFKLGRSSRWRLSELMSWETDLSRMQSSRSPVLRG